MASLKREILAGAALALASGLASSCASAPPAPPAPAWTTQAERTMDGGYIIYVGAGEDLTQERSHFKAQGMALQNLVNECSLAPKGARMEDGYDKQDEETRKYRSWVKIAVQYEDCEEAKKAVDPADIRKVGNTQLTEELARYQKMVDEPPPPALASAPTAGPAPATGGATVVYYPAPPPSGVMVVAVNNTGSFYWARQQVAYTKQIVLLSPPAAYPPGAPQTEGFVHQLQPAQASVVQYEAANPAMRTSTQAYSSQPVRQQMIQQRAMARSYAPPRRFGGRQQGPPKGRGNGGANRKRKKRYGW